MLWFWTSSQNIHKIIEGSNLSFETSDDTGHNLSQRFIDFRKQYEQNIYSKGLYDLPIATSRLCDKSEVCVGSCNRNRVLRADCEFPNHDLVITRGKDSEDKGSMPEFLQSIRDITTGFANLIGTLSSTIQAVLPARLQFRFLQQQQILPLKQTQSYLTLVKLTPMAKNEFL